MDLQCKACQRVFEHPNSLYQHFRDKHDGPRLGKGQGRKRHRSPRKPPVEHEESMADLRVAAEMAIACGEEPDEFTMAVFGDYLPTSRAE